MLVFLLSFSFISINPFLITISSLSALDEVALDGVATDDVARVGGLEISYSAISRLPPFNIIFLTFSKEFSISTGVQLV